MNSWVIIFLGGPVGSNIIIYGTYSSLAGAMAEIVTTGQPASYLPCEVWGPPVTEPTDQYTPQSVDVGNWIAVTPGLSENGGTRMIGYGPFSTLEAAQLWSQGPVTAGTFSFGQVLDDGGI